MLNSKQRSNKASRVYNHVREHGLTCIGHHLPPKITRQATDLPSRLDDVLVGEAVESLTEHRPGDASGKRAAENDHTHQHSPKRLRQTGDTVYPHGTPS